MNDQTSNREWAFTVLRLYHPAEGLNNSWKCVTSRLLLWRERYLNDLFTKVGKGGGQPISEERTGGSKISILLMLTRGEGVNNPENHMSKAPL